MHVFGNKKPKKKDDDKKRKLKSPQDRGGRSEGQSSASQSVPVDDLPEEFSFLWSIDAIETFYDGKHPPRVLGVCSKDNNDVAKLWFPPNHPSMFHRIRKGKLYRWFEGDSEILPNVERPKAKFAVSSIFFQADQDNFVACHNDCTHEDISRLDTGWCYLGFNHPGNGLSEIDIFSRASRHRLAAPAKGSTWMPQVLPEVYDFNTKGREHSVYKGPLGGLCGRLTLLIGMAAFSAPVNYEEATVAGCFGFGEWRPHDTEIGVGRYQERGVVVSIYLDPSAVGTTSKHLRNFEKGYYGPIFANDLVDQDPPTLPAAPVYELYATASSVPTSHTTPRVPGQPTYTYTMTSPPTTSARLTLPETQSTSSRSDTGEGDEIAEG